jgi:hypothetical protein
LQFFRKRGSFLRHMSVTKDEYSQVFLPMPGARAAEISLKEAPIVMKTPSPIYNRLLSVTRRPAAADVISRIPMIRKKTSRAINALFLYAKVSPTFLLFSIFTIT